MCWIRDCDAVLPSLIRIVMGSPGGAAFLKEEFMSERQYGPDFDSFHDLPQYVGRESEEFQLQKCLPHTILVKFLKDYAVEIVRFADSLSAADIEENKVKIENDYHRPIDWVNGMTRQCGPLVRMLKITDMRDVGKSIV